MMTMQEVEIAKIHREGRIRQDFGDIAALARSMHDIGLLHPIIVTTTYTLVVGARRVCAAQQLGWTTILAQVIAPDKDEEPHD